MDKNEKEYVLSHYLELTYQPKNFYSGIMVGCSMLWDSLLYELDELISDKSFSDNQKQLILKFFNKIQKLYKDELLIKYPLIPNF